MPKRFTPFKKVAEGSALDRRIDKMHPGMKEGSPKEEAFDRKMAKKIKKSGRKRK